MEATTISENINLSKSHGVESRDIEEELQELVQRLPKERFGFGRDENSAVYFYQGFWCPFPLFKATISFQKHFETLDNDIFLTTPLKCGTTWMKALIFTIVNRHKFQPENNPLLTSLTPHQAMPYVEVQFYLKNQEPNLSHIPQPRLLHTHLPYSSLPPSIRECPTAKIVYICRNPMDMFISTWHFIENIRPANEEPFPLDEAFEKFCRGVHAYGPYSDHILGFWKAKQENSNKILFLKYEDVKADTFSHVKTLANFLGFPFSEEEEKKGVVEEIIKLCSFENLKELEVNKSGYQAFGLPNSAFFRKGEVGDSTNYLTPAMVERLEKSVLGKFDKSGLTFKISSKTNCE
ncbi:hypothetical protein COLO4_21704 [Corchorus olitorius]|uniref:Sulfotransferase n=1 Tax=Corchorus olitorius TaxID=93759 RepID=A0A1R3IRK7_9ROSI|nr:hypothetical protein COLO4_21704 [Corchorus olitorius]